MAIVYPYTGDASQFWDIYSAGNGDYVIYNHGTNNVLTSDGSCTSNGGNYKFCVLVQPFTGTATQEWVELRTDPIVFENAASSTGGRCLDNPGGDSPPPQAQVVLYPCSTTDHAEQWLG